MKFYSSKIKFNYGFSLLELLISMTIISITSSLIFPLSLTWLRKEKVNAYTRELSAFLRLIRLEARRWGASCFINTNYYDYLAIPNDKKYIGYDIDCKYSTDLNDSSKPSVGRIQELAPSLDNSLFQVVNNNFQITPNGRVSAKKPIVIVIGSRYHKTRPRTLNCITINIPTGQIKKGIFSSNYWLSDNMPVSSLSNDSALEQSKCEIK